MHCVHLHTVIGAVNAWRDSRHKTLSERTEKDRTKTRHDEAFAEHVEEHDERGKKIARHSHGAQETTHNQPSSSSSSSGAIRADSNVQHRQESNDSVHKQDVDMNNDDKEKQDPRRKQRVTSLPAGTEKHKMMTTETARGKDYHP